MNKATIAAILATANAAPLTVGGGSVGTGAGAGATVATFDSVNLNVPVVNLNVPYQGMQWSGISAVNLPKLGGTPKLPFPVPASGTGVGTFPKLSIPTLPLPSVPGTGSGTGSGSGSGISIPSIPGVPSTGSGSGSGISIPTLPLPSVPGTGSGTGSGIPSVPGVPGLNTPTLPSMGITFPGSKSGSFDLNSLSFACAAKGTTTTTGAAKPCTLNIKGYTDDAMKTLAAAQSVVFNVVPKVSPGVGVGTGNTVPMLLVTLNNAFKNLKKVTFEVVNTAGQAAADLGMIDGVTYHLHPSVSGSTPHA